MSVAQVETELKEQQATEEDGMIKKQLQNIFEYTSRLEQLEAIEKLAFIKQNVILIAKTGFDKSIVFQAVPMLTKGICLMIMLLTVLEEEQSAKINRLSSTHSKAIMLQADNCDLMNLAAVQNGQYTHIFLSSEIAIFRCFHKAVLTHFSF